MNKKNTESLLSAKEIMINEELDQATRTNRAAEAERSPIIIEVCCVVMPPLVDF